MFCLTSNTVPMEYFSLSLSLSLKSKAELCASHIYLHSTDYILNSLEGLKCLFLLHTYVYFYHTTPV